MATICNGGPFQQRATTISYGRQLVKKCEKYRTPGKKLSGGSTCWTHPEKQVVPTENELKMKLEGPVLTPSG